MHSRWALACILAIAAIARLGFVLKAGILNADFGDARDYIEAAQSFCSGAPYPERCALPFFRAPFYPLFIAAFSFCNVESIYLLKIIQIALDCGTVALVFILTRMLSNSDQASLVSAGLAAVYPPFFLNVNEVQSEPLFTFLLLFAVTLLVRGHQRKWNVHFALAGFLLGLACLTRPVISGFFSILLIWHLVQYRFSDAILRFLTVFLLFCVAVFPWTFQNYLRFGEFILVNDAAGYNFWRDNTESAWKRLTSKTPAEYERYHEDLFQKTAAYDLTIRSQFSTPKSRERAWLRLAWNEISPHLDLWVGRWIYKLAYFWRFWLNANSYSIGLVAFSFLVFGFTYSIGAFGMIRCYSQRRAEVQLFVSLFLFASVAHAAFLPGIRMRTPFVDPYLIIFCGMMLTSWVKKLKETASIKIV